MTNQAYHRPLENTISLNSTLKGRPETAADNCDGSLADMYRMRVLLTIVAYTLTAEVKAFDNNAQLSCGSCSISGAFYRFTSGRV